MAVTRIKNNQVTDATLTGGKLVDNTVTAGKLENNLTYGSNLTVTGNLTVNGATNTVSTTNTTVEDAVIVLNSEVSGTGSTRDMGIYGEYGDDASVFMGYDVSASEFVLVSTASAGTATAITATDYKNLHLGGLTADDNITATGTVQGATVTDGTASLASGSLTSAVNGTFSGTVTGGTVTDGTASLSSGSLASAVNGTFSGTVTGGTLTDGAFSVSSGAVTGVTTLSTSGEATLASAIVQDLTATRVTFAGSGGALADDAELTYTTASNTLAAGNISTAGTMTATGAVSGGSITTTGTLNADGATTLGQLTIDASSTVDMGANKVTNVADPVSNQDAATKNYVDTALSTVFTVTDGTTSQTIADGDTLTFNGTANEIEVAVSATDQITISLPDDVTIGDTLTVTGNLIVQGTTTTVNSTVTQVVDPIFQIGRGADNAALESDDAKDRGMSMYYYEGSEKIAFMGFDTTANTFKYFSDATISSEVVSGTLGTAEFGKVVVDNIDIDGNTLTSTNTNGNLELAANGAGKINVATGNEVVIVDLDDTALVFSNSGELTTSTSLTWDGSALDASNLTTGGGVTATGTVQGGTVTDGTASLSSGSLTSAVNGTFSGTVTGGTLTDGTASITSGAVSGVTTLSTSGEATLASAIVSDLTATRVTFAGTLGALVDDAELTYTTASNTLAAGNITSAGTIQGGTVTDGAFSATSGAVTGVTTLATSGEATLASAIVQDLTDNRVVVAGTSGALEDDANFTWTGSTLQVGTNTASTDVTLKVGGVKSMMPPVGDNSGRPVTPIVGMLRFNTSLDSLEQYASTGWEAVGALTFTVIASQTFDGDGATTAFTLSESQTTASCIVSINGVVQLPTDAYSVSTTTLTFTEAPASGDKIEVRKITTTQTVTNLESSGGEASVTTQTTGEVDVKGNLMPSADSTYSIGNAAVRWTDIYVDAGSIYLGDVTLKASAGTLQVFGSDGTTPAPTEVTSITKGGTDGVGDIGQTGNRFATIYGTSTSAEYADLAEKYEADAEYEAGTVVHFGGDKEVTQCDADHCTRVAGVVSTAPAYRMNDGLEAEHTAMVALTGRVPCKVTGPVAKGDMMVSAGNGMARAEANPTYGAVIGKALENWEGGEGVIEVVVK